MNNPFVVLDFEFRGGVPGRVEPVCVVAREIDSGLVHRMWLEGETPSSPPFPCGPDTLLVAHAVAPAEARCWRVLGWPEPGGWIDTSAEERVQASGEKPVEGFGLLACCRRNGIHCISPDDKNSMRDLVIGGGPYTAGQKREILDYCESDVQETSLLFEKQLPGMNVRQALFRGRYLAESAQIGDRGLPVDVGRFQRVHDLENSGMRKLIAEHLDPHGLVENGTFDYGRFAKMVEQSGIDWPLTETGRYRRDKDTLKEANRVHGEPWTGVYELTRTLNAGVVDALKPGSDGRLYAAPRPFATITGRCAPSTSEFLWSGPKWLRSLVQPPPGRSILYIDWSNQEHAIAAALSEDPAMLGSYASGDPYLALAKAAGAVPEDATKATHAKKRDIYKIVSLAVLMGMGSQSIGQRTGGGPYGGRALLDLHKRRFSRFWEWSDSVAATGAAARNVETAFGLIYNPAAPSHYKPRTARNFLLQATGSDMLRVAVLLLADAGVEVIATVHDAVLVECDTAAAETVGQTAVSCMEEASRITLWDRLTVRASVERVDHPLHYMDKGGAPFWRKLARLLELPLDSRDG